MYIPMQIVSLSRWILLESLVRADIFPFGTFTFKIENLFSVEANAKK